MSTDIVPFEFGERGIILRSVADLMEFATIAHKSKLAPAGMDTPEKIFICCQFGAENGMGPMQSLRCIVVINNMPAWRGDAALALALRRPGVMLSCSKGFEGEKEDRAAYFESTRRGWAQPKRTVFSIASAKRAGLWGKAGTWTTYPDRMMYYRALGFHLRDNYPDVLMGLSIAEEVADIPAATERTEKPAIVANDPLLIEVESKDAPLTEVGA